MLGEPEQAVLGLERSTSFKMKSIFQNVLC